MVKANAYGHRAAGVAAAAAGAAWLGVARPEEALALRAPGIGAPVLVHAAAVMPQNYVAFQSPLMQPEWWRDIVTGLSDPIMKDGLFEVRDRPRLAGPGPALFGRIIHAFLAK